MVKYLDKFSCNTILEVFKRNCKFIIPDMKIGDFLMVLALKGRDILAQGEAL
jgi:hypothetical protein